MRSGSTKPAAVGAQFVVGIVGVETIYGQQMGNFRVIDALATLAFDFPPAAKDRSAFFRDELESLFVLCHSEGLDPLEPKGSFAGAMGMPQFMPSSFNKYAVDMDGDGHDRSAWQRRDVIGSVAHYLAESAGGAPADALRPGRPVDTSDRAALPRRHPAQLHAREFAERGANIDPAALAADVRSMATGGVGKLALVELQNGDAAPSYVAARATSTRSRATTGRATTRWHVIELGEAVARELGRSTR